MEGPDTEFRSVFNDHVRVKVTDMLRVPSPTGSGNMPVDVLEVT